MHGHRRSTFHGSSNISIPFKSLGNIRFIKIQCPIFEFRLATKIALHHALFHAFTRTITMLQANPNYVTVSRNCVSPTSEYFRRETSKPFFLYVGIHADAWKRERSTWSTGNAWHSDFYRDKIGLNKRSNTFYFIVINYYYHSYKWIETSTVCIDTSLIKQVKEKLERKENKK